MVCALNSVNTNREFFGSDVKSIIRACCPVVFQWDECYHVDININHLFKNRCNESFFGFRTSIILSIVACGKSNLHNMATGTQEKKRHKKRNISIVWNIKCSLIFFRKNLRMFTRRSCSWCVKLRYCTHSSLNNNLMIFIMVLRVKNEIL